MPRRRSWLMKGFQLITPRSGIRQNSGHGNRNSGEFRYKKSFLINLFRVENPLAHHGNRILIQPPEKAAFIAFVASGAADLVDLEQEGVGVAIEENLFDFLHM